jgi:hypothetical protein
MFSFSCATGKLQLSCYRAPRRTRCGCWVRLCCAAAARGAPGRRPARAGRHASAACAAPSRPSPPVAGPPGGAAPTQCAHRGAGAPAPAAPADGGGPQPRARAPAAAPPAAGRAAGLTAPRSVARPSGRCPPFDSKNLLRAALLHSNRPSAGRSSLRGGGERGSSGERGRGEGEACGEVRRGARAAAASGCILAPRPAWAGCPSLAAPTHGTHRAPASPPARPPARPPHPQ